MKLPPYTVPEQDADLWECGRRLDTSLEQVSRGDVKQMVLDELKRAGAAGVPTKSELARRVGLRIDRVTTALRDAHVHSWYGTPIYHPDFEPPWDEGSDT